MASPSAPPLTYEQTTRLILSKLKDLESSVVLIGGQAVNFWASYYAEKLPPDLAALAPFASKDVDFCGLRAAVTECARRLGGQAILATLDDATPNTGVVAFVDDDGVHRSIDFLANPGGLEYGETLETSVGAQILDEEGHPTGASFRVMHAVLCLESRAFNVANLPGYDGQHAVEQLRAAIACAHEFLVDLMTQNGGVRSVLKLNERIFGLAAYRAGLEVFVRHGIDVFEAVLLDDALPEKFRTVRYSQMRAFVGERRNRRAQPPRSG
jgi:hypothetical protein